MTENSTRPLDEQPITDAAHTAAAANIAPEVDQTSEEEQAQAQTLADDLVRRKADMDGGESEHGNGDVPLGSEDVPDVVDHMNQMESSGIIENDAYRGERNDDDESHMLGEDGMEDGDRDESGQELQAID